jgi:sugar lactone lactonase YvrE
MRHRIAITGNAAVAASRLRPRACKLLRMALCLLLLCSAFARVAKAQELQLSGTDFGVLATNQNTQQTLTLTVGADDVVLNSINVIGSYSYYVSNNSCALNSDLPAGTVCTMTVSFQPNHVGYASAPLPFSNSSGLQIAYTDQVTNAPQTQTFLLTGSGRYPTSVLYPGLISDLIGSDSPSASGFAGDGGPASAALFRNPGAITVDAYGDIYIADTGNNVIRVVYQGGRIPNVINPQYGSIYTIAGIAPASGAPAGSTAGAGTDGVCATASHLNGPAGVALDVYGNLYIADNGNNAIRIVYANGIIGTAAGTLNSVETAGTGFSGDLGPATAAQVYQPAGITVDGFGNLYIADVGNNAIRVVYQADAPLAAQIALQMPGTTPVAGDIYTIAGGPANAPATNNGDGGLASAANLSSPLAVTIDSTGDIYIADTGNHALRRVDAVTGNISSIYSGTDAPTNLSVDAADDIYFTLHIACTVSQYNPTMQTDPAVPVTSVVAGNASCAASGDSGAATQAGLNGALGVVVDPAGNLNILESDGVRQVMASQSSLNFGSANVGTTSATQTAFLTDEDLLPQPNTNNYSLLQPVYFSIQGQSYGTYIGPPPFATVPYVSTNPNVFDCNGIVNGGSYPNVTLKPGQSCGVSFDFQPYADGASVPSFTSGGGYIQLTGTGTGPLPTATLTGTPVNFVSVSNEAVSATQTFTLTNTSNITLTFSSIYFSSYNGFGETDTCGLSTQVSATPTLAAGASCQINVIFQAQALGNVSTTLNVIDNASSGGGIQSLALTGTGTAPIGGFSTLSFGTTAPGTTNTQVFNFTNSGTAALHYNPASWAIAGYDPSKFAITANNCTTGTLAINASCSLTVSFSPTTWAYDSADLTVQDDSGGVRIFQGVYQYITQTGHMVGVTGNPTLGSSITAANTAFPITAVGSGTTQTVTLTLATAAALKSIAMPPAFTEYSIGAITGCTVDGSTVNTIGSVCSVPITFTPSAPGVRNAPLSVVDIEGTTSQPYAFALTGNGQGPQAALTPGIITTVIGSGFGYATGIVGPDGPATAAAVGFTGGMALDAAGQLYLADTQNAVIWKTDTSGNIHLFAGTPFPPGGYLQPITGDGGTALGAQLSYVSPMPLALDAKGGLYIGDNSPGSISSQGTEVRYIDPATNLITSAAGFVTPFSWTSATAFVITARITVTVSSVKYLFVTTKGGTSGAQAPTWPTAKGASVNDGTIVWQNQGVYFGGPGCVAQTDTLGDGCVASAALIGTVSGIVLDAAGDVYFSDVGYIRRIDATTKIVTTVAGNGTPGYSVDGTQAAQAKIIATALAFDSNGNLYFVDAGNLLRTINIATGNITTVAGTHNYAVPYEGTYCATSSGDGGLATAAGFSTITDVTFDAANNIYLVDQFGCHVRRIDAATGIIHNVAGIPGQYNYINRGFGDLNQGPNTHPDGDATLAALNEPGFVRLDGNGSLYIASAFGGVRKVDVTQSVLNFSGSNDTTGFNIQQQVDTASLPQTATVTNIGNSGMVAFTSPFISPTWGIASPNFTRDVTNPAGSADCYTLGSIGSGYECPVSVDFTPLTSTANGEWLTGIDLVNDNAPSRSGVQPIALFGNAYGTPPDVTLLPFLLSFSVAQGGTSIPQSLTLTNNGATALSISSISIGGANASSFGQTNNCGSSLAANSSCTISVTFSPAIVGGTYVNAPPPDVLTATVSVMDTAGNAPQTAQLVGTGTLPAVSEPPVLVNITETIHVSDIITPPVAPVIVAVTEAIHITDNVVPPVSPVVIGVVETIHITDTVTPPIPPAVIGVTEAIHIADTVTPPVAPAIIGVVETIHITDTVKPPLPAAIIGVTEAIHITDIVTPPLSPLSINVTEALHVTDVPTITLHTPPLARLSGPSNGTTGNALTFSGSGSTASSPAAITTYSWNFGDSATTTTTTSNSLAHIYTTAGLYTVTLTVTDSDGAVSSPSTFTLNITSGVPGFTLVANPPSLVLRKGQSVSTTITLTPTFGYKGTATLSCTGLPAYSSCIFVPSILLADGSNTPVSTVLTIYTLSTTAVKTGTAAAIFWIPGIILTLLCGLGRKRLSKRLQRSLLLLLLSTVVLGATACGSGDFTTPTGTANVSVIVNMTATAGTGSPSLQQSLNIPLTVNP